MIEILKPDFEFSDERGKLTQLVNSGFKQINVIKSKADVKRGGHYHKLNKEAFYIIEGELDLFVKKDGCKEEYHFSSGDMFLINEFVFHDFFFTTETILVSMYDNGVELELGKKDIYTA